MMKLGAWKPYVKSSVWNRIMDCRVKFIAGPVEGRTRWPGNDRKRNFHTPLSFRDASETSGPGIQSHTFGLQPCSGFRARAKRRAPE